MLRLFLERQTSSTARFAANISIGGYLARYRDEYDLKDGQPAKLVIRPEDVFLRRPENLMQNYQKLTDGVVEEMSFVGPSNCRRFAFNPWSAADHCHAPKTETGAFQLSAARR